MKIKRLKTTAAHLMTSQSTQCPSPRCSAEQSPQYMVDAELLRAAGIQDAWIASAIHCSHCGMIYSVHADGSKQARGHFAGDQIDRWRACSGGTLSAPRLVP